MIRYVRRVLLSLATFVALAAIVGCSTPPPKPPVTPTAADAGPATCLDLCRHYSELGCAAANPTPAGASCVDVCSHYQAMEIARWDLDCRSHATVCDPPSCR